MTGEARTSMAVGFRRLLPLLAMVAVFAAPVVAAWFFYLNPEYLPAARSNRGELLEPVVPLDASLGLERAGGGEFDLSSLAGRWTLVTVSAGPCLADCRRRLSDQGQVWAALGESRLSVERMLIVTATGSGPVAHADTLAPDLREVHVAIAGPAASTTLASILGADGLERHYILDPLGGLMMRYPHDAPPEDLLKDMERLLKASKNWIKGAQYGHQ